MIQRMSPAFAVLSKVRMNEDKSKPGTMKEICAVTNPSGPVEQLTMRQHAILSKHCFHFLIVA